MADRFPGVSTDGPALFSPRTGAIAAGAWTGELATSHLPWIPLRVTRQQIVYVEQHVDFPVVVDRGTTLCCRYAIPQRFGAPGAPGAPGARAGRHGIGTDVLPDEPRRKDPAIISRVIDFIAESIPAVGTEPTALETVLYTNTTDNGFVLNRVGPLVVASPCVVNLTGSSGR